jgi:HEAT repeat protein
VARLCGSLKAGRRAAGRALNQAATSDPDAKVRAAAATAAAHVLAPEDLVALLEKVLQDKDPSVRLVAAARLRQLGPPAAAAAKQLALALADEKQDVAEAAAEALVRIGPPAVQPLAEQLASKNVAAKKLALAALARLGPTAKAAGPAIEKCKQDAEAQVRQLAEAALQRIGS